MRIYHTDFKLVITILILLFFSPSDYLYAQNTLSMQLYHEDTGGGTDIWAGGDSFILSNGRLKSQSRIFLEEFPNTRKVILIWSGEVKNDNPRFQQIELIPARKKNVSIKADSCYRADSTGLLYSCVADITPHYNGKGDYIIQGLQSDHLTRNDQSDPFSVAGYAILVLYENSEQGNRTVRVYAGLDVLGPGEMHDISILDNGSDASLSKMVLVGGHGRKGNGSANLLNGTSISQSEDWNGSSGDYWDVDLFENIDVDRNRAAKNGLILSIDTVLQWVYPVVIAAVFEEKD